MGLNFIEKRFFPFWVVDALGFALESNRRAPSSITRSSDAAPTFVVFPAILEDFQTVV
jgi:hypothetical protein